MLDQRRRILFTQIPKTGSTSIFAAIHTADEMWAMRRAFAGALAGTVAATERDMERSAAARYIRGIDPLERPAPPRLPLTLDRCEAGLRAAESGRFLNLCRVGFGLYARHMTFAQAEALLRPCGDPIDDYRSFSFVRNPWDWMLSQYYFSIEYLGRRRDPAPARAFEAFLADYAEARPASSEAFCQADHLSDSSGDLRIGMIGRFETLAADLPVLGEFLGIRVERVDHLRKGELRPPGHYRQHYDDRSRRAVARLCERDIDLFGYSF